MLAILLGLSFAPLLAAGSTASQSISDREQAKAEQPERPGAIGGRVKDAGTGTPLPGSVVVLVMPAMSSESRRVRRQAETDEEGHYRFEDLRPGRYWVNVQSADRLGPKGSRLVTLRPGQQLDAIDFALVAYGVMSGKVLDVNKEPVPRAMVQAIAREYFFGVLEYIVKEGGATDDRGEYVLPLLEPGRAYVVRAEKREPRLVSGARPDPTKRKETFAPTFYPNSDAIELAVPLVLRTGERREGIDIEMMRSRSYCIEGIVEADGLPAVMDVSVVEQALAASTFHKPGAKSGPDGRFRVCDLQPGEYRITAYETLPGPNGEPPRFGCTTVTIVDEDVGDVRVAAQRGLPLSGQVVWDGSPPVEPVESKVGISLQPATRYSFLNEQLDVQSSVPGEFTFAKLLMDDYSVWAGAGSASGIYVKDVLYGGRSIKNKLLRLAGVTSAPGELSIILGGDGGTVSAKAVDRDGNPIADSYVLILPAEVRAEADLASALISGQTDQNGVYSSRPLATGKYYLLASNTPSDATPETIRTLWNLRPNAKEVEIGAAGTAQATLELTNIR
ncbi:MAG: carboxypeptidase regulatory-like domain-containing protein [Bryobacteraceae bacterium]|nr:carboxypeptidase regulatory-like domain-containing protein [Bryobacteraceae bacterium]